MSISAIVMLIVAILIIWGGLGFGSAEPAPSSGSGCPR